jgi:large subunit ribosomal protein L9
MKVILLRDVARLGKRYSVVEVPDGFALNKLIPQGMAQPATPENLKRVQARAKEVAEHAAHDAEVLKRSLAALSTTPLSLTAAANAQGSLFKAFKAEDVSAAATAAGHPVPTEAIIVKEPLKSVGTHTLDVVAGSIKGQLTVVITAQ